MKNRKDSFRMHTLREHLAHYGSSLLSPEELLRLVLDLSPDETTGHAPLARFLTERGMRGLARAEQGELCLSYGLSPELAARVVALAELSRRLATLSVELPMTITTPQEAARHVLPLMSHLEREQMRILLLDIRHHLLANIILYEGTLKSLSTRVAEVFRLAITRQAAALIVCHNHPSGSIEPSPEDILFTNDLIAAGDLLDIAVLDHLIIANGHYCSVMSLLARSSRRDATGFPPEGNNLFDELDEAEQ
jgi:DNA repair protein RadC